MNTSELKKIIPLFLVWFTLWTLCEQLFIIYKCSVHTKVFMCSIGLCIALYLIREDKDDNE